MHTPSVTVSTCNRSKMTGSARDFLSALSRVTSPLLQVFLATEEVKYIQYMIGH